MIWKLNAYRDRLDKFMLFRCSPFSYCTISFILGNVCSFFHYKIFKYFTKSKLFVTHLFFGDLSMHFNVWNISLRFSFCVFISFNPLEYPCSIASYALFECHPEGPRDYIFFSLINSGVNKCNSHSLWNDQRTKNTTVEKECQKATDHILQCAL